MRPFLLYPNEPFPYMKKRPRLQAGAYVFQKIYLPNMIFSLESIFAINSTRSAV